MTIQIVRLPIARDNETKDGFFSAAEREAITAAFASELRRAKHELDAMLSDGYQKIGETVLHGQTVTTYTSNSEINKVRLITGTVIVFVLFQPPSVEVDLEEMFEPKSEVLE